jgi:hypothetical protein
MTPLSQVFPSQNPHETFKIPSNFNIVLLKKGYNNPQKRNQTERNNNSINPVGAHGMRPIAFYT